FALILARTMLGAALLHRETDAERDRGLRILTKVRDLLVGNGQSSVVLPIANIYLGREMARRGNRDGGILTIRAAAGQLIGEGRLLGWGIPVTDVLVETLLERGTDSDVAEAAAAIERLAAVQPDDFLPVRDVLLLRLRARLARARGDAAGYTDLRD